MPRVIPYERKERWFEEFEKGSSVAKLANYHKKDPRTIQRGIEEVRNRRLTAQVRIEVLKEGIRKHQEVLLEALSRAAEPIVPMAVHIEEHPPRVSPLSNSGGWMFSLRKMGMSAWNSMSSGTSSGSFCGST